MNRETKFTPGPWTIKERAGNLIDISADPHGLVASVARWFYGHPGSREENQANAHLIAAAPALYEAIQRFVDACDAHRPAWLGNSEARRGFDELRAALALVDGQQEGG